MKTNPFARSMLKARVLALLLATAAMAGAGFALGDVLPKKSRPVDPYHAPNVSLAGALNLVTP